VWVEQRGAIEGTERRRIAPKAPGVVDEHLDPAQAELGKPCRAERVRPLPWVL
jgi:hypothetical protein